MPAHGVLRAGNGANTAHVLFSERRRENAWVMQRIVSRDNGAAGYAYHEACLSRSFCIVVTKRCVLRLN